jgi:hypothetical protein
MAFQIYTIGLSEANKELEAWVLLFLEISTI